MSTTVLESIPLRLRTLRDIEGVLGSFVVGSRGELLARDVPAACGSQVLAIVGGRLQQLCNAFASAQVGGPFEGTTLYFPQYKLHIRALGNVLIVAVISANVNLPALKMAINLLGRQLLVDLAAVSRESTTGVPPVRASRTTVAPPAPQARASRTSVSPPTPPVSPAAHPEHEPPSATHEKLRPSQEPPQPSARESGVPARSYRGTRVAN